MKKFVFLVIVMAGFGSCDLVDQIIPDVDTEYEETFLIKISDNMGFTDPELVDISSSAEYEEFRNNIDGFEINEIVVKVVSFDGPEDMYFNGKVLALDTLMTTEVEVGSFMGVNLSEVSVTDTSIIVDQIVSGIEQVAAWLEDPGRFYARASFNLTDEEGEPYLIGENEYNLELSLKYSVTVITVANNEEAAE